LLLGGQRGWIGHDIRIRRIRHGPDCPSRHGGMEDRHQALN
jgi:hypothetical protein